jgi:hypothetical protein
MTLVLLEATLAMAAIHEKKVNEDEIKENFDH